ncbi:MAG TPA: alpha/beta hydrolase, partial [Nocardioidaceae bacterium]
MPVDPHIAPLLELLAQVPAMHEGTPEEAREAFRQLTVASRRPEHIVPVGSEEDIVVPGPEGDIGARVYRPEAPAGDLPTVMLFHGGGWVIGDIETHDNMARSLCRDCSAVVVSVDYRLAPESPFPAAVDDAIEATRWVGGRLGEFGGSDRLAVAGDSAGGNLAAVVAQQLRDTGGPALAAQLLVYPACDVTGEYPSRHENAAGYFLDLPTMAWFLNHYAADAAVHEDPRISPLQHGDLAGLPPAVVVTAEYDPLRDEGKAYADALARAGVPVVERCF